MRRAIAEPAGGGLRLLLARALGRSAAAVIGDRAGVVFGHAARHEVYGIVAVWRDPWGNRRDLIQPA